MTAEQINDPCFFCPHCDEIILVEETEEYTSAWRCIECGEVYMLKDEAENCCSDDEGE